MTSVQRVPIVAILGLCLFLAGVASAPITPYRGIVAIDGLGIGNETYAIVLAWSSVGAALGSVALGQLPDKVRDRRLIVIVCALLGALAFGLIFLNQTQLAYTFAVCVILPFSAALFSQSFAFARTYLVQSGAKNTEFLISALRSLFTFAWVVTPQWRAGSPPPIPSSPSSASRPWRNCAACWPLSICTDVVTQRSREPKSNHSIPRVRNRPCRFVASSVRWALPSCALPGAEPHHLPLGPDQ